MHVSATGMLSRKKRVNVQGSNRSHTSNKNGAPFETNSKEATSMKKVEKTRVCACYFKYSPPLLPPVLNNVVHCGVVSVYEENVHQNDDDYTRRLTDEDHLSQCRANAFQVDFSPRR